MSFAENTSKNIGKNISKSWSNKYRQKLLYHTKQPATNALKTASKIAIEKLAEAISDFSHNKITKVSRSLPQNSSETVEIQDLIEKYRKKDIYLQKKKDSKLLKI